MNGLGIIPLIRNYKVEICVKKLYIKVVKIKFILTLIYLNIYRKLN